MSTLSKPLILFFLCICSVPVMSQAVYSCKSGNVSFFSEAPLENIEGKSQNGVAVLNTTKNEIVFSVQIKSFHFDRALMQEHFNENYMESDKFPKADFKGKITDNIDWNKDGEYTIKAKGKLTVHGVTKPRDLSGTIKINNGVISLLSSFEIACKDHNIKIPSVVATKVAEVVKVNVNSDFQNFTVR